jgi:hypothetical protein
MAPMSYEIRPSKAVTRQIFVDLLRRLMPLGSPKEYQYVGFGALEFIDFDLIHRHVGVTDMISIEADSFSIARYEWNRPFNSIAVMPGRASTILSSIDWRRLSIVWLDYTSQLTTEVISDAETLARVLIPGSVLAITVNGQPLRYGEGRRTALERNITRERVPIGVTDDRLGSWGLAEVQYEVLTAELTKSFAARGDAAKFRQLLNIHYKDTVQMQMVVGIVSAPGMDSFLDQCRFDDVGETRTGKEALHIRVPLLTAREQAWANQRLPLAPGDAPLELTGVNPQDLQDYADVYRRLTAVGSG